MNRGQVRVNAHITLMPSQTSATKIKAILGATAILAIVAATQIYPRTQFTKQTGLHIPAMALAVKWHSGLDDFFAAFLTTPESARNLMLQTGAWPGKEWRNDTLKLNVYSARRNVPFFDLDADALTSTDHSRWFLANIVRKSANDYVLKGAIVVVYPEQGLIFINAGG